MNTHQRAENLAKWLAYGDYKSEREIVPVIRASIEEAIMEAVKKVKSECDHESPCCDECIDKFKAQGKEEAHRTMQGLQTVLQRSTDMTDSFEEGYSVARDQANEICMGLWLEATNNLPDFEQNKLSHGCLACAKAISKMSLDKPEKLK